MEKFTILYVDDEESNLRIFRDTFRRKYNVLTATSAKQGMDILEGNRVDLILSDQRMPEMTGVEFLKYTFERFPQANRILVTGFTDFSAVENAINQARVFQYVQKPWDEEALNNTIEDALRIYRLEQENALQKEELIQAKRKAEESDRLKSAFLHNLSHEIRTPLNGIYGFSNLIAEEKTTIQERDRFAKLIKNCINQLLETVDHILEYSKLITKEVKPNFQELKLNELLAELHDVFTVVAKEKQLSFNVEEGLTDENSVVFTDKIQLYSVLSSLLDNAFKFTESGSVGVEYKLEGENIIISIADTGVGIHRDYQKDIFSRFTREESEYTSQTGGLGIGLSIAKESAKLVGADIWFKSEKGEGTIFYVSIPYNLIDYKTKSGDRVHRLISELEKKKKYKVLVAEDDYINYLYIETLLNKVTNGKLSILHSRNGKEAIEASKNNPDLDLVFMDIKMPVINGYDAALEIKRFLPKLPIVAQTAYSSEEDRQKAEKAKCDGFISKPIHRSELESVLEKFLI